MNQNTLRVLTTKLYLMVSQSDRESESEYFKTLKTKGQLMISQADRDKYYENV